MATNDGQQVGIAFEAVLQCHKDLGRLIADLDGYMTKQKWSRLWSQDAVTSGVSRAAYAPFWMAKRLYRLYQNEDSAPGVVEGINVRFFSEDSSLKEPRLVIGRGRYNVPANKTVAKIAETWDFDDAIGKWCNAQSGDLGKVLSCEHGEKSIEKMCVIAVDLYSITTLDQVTKMLADVRKEFEVNDD